MSGESFMQRERAEDGTPIRPDVEDFNLDDWISGARLPEKSVTVYGRADLVAEFYELERQLQNAGKEAVDDGRLTGDPRVILAQRMEEVRTQMQASALTFRFRALLDSEVETAKKAHKGSDETLSFALLTIQAVQPKVPEEKWPLIREKIGDGQFAALLEAAGTASYDRQVSVPFSLAASALLTSKDS